MPEVVDFTTGETAILYDKFVIGRALDCSRCIEDVSISRRHCQFDQEDGHWYLTDLSSNGMFINEIKPQKHVRTRLKHNDTFQISTYLFAFRAYSEPASNLQTAEVINVEESESEPEVVVDNPQVVAEAQLTQPAAEVAGPTGGSALDDLNFHEELTCSICTELFINAVTLNCQHTYCELCIFTWRKNNKNCPICRLVITHQSPTLAINNLISLVISKKTDEEKKARQATVEARQAEFTKASKPTRGAASRGRRGRWAARNARSRATTSGRAATGGGGPTTRRRTNIMDFIDLDNSDSDFDSDTDVEDEYISYSGIANVIRDIFWP